MKTCWNCDAEVPSAYRYCLACGEDVDAKPALTADPLLGTTISEKFRLIERIGEGSMGTIYRAEQLSLGKVIVVKLLHKHMLSDPELTQRFHREAQAASRLNQPNCVQVIDFGATEDGTLYLAMEFIPGKDLATVLEDDFPLDHRRVLHIMMQICLALDEAHANGVLHRDLKPENIMVFDRRNETDFVKVVDFGIAKLEESNPTSSRRFKTKTGMVCGTPEYMSPEQARGKPLDARSDVYALGIALYHLTTDRLPFDAESPIEIVTMHLTEEPVAPSRYRSDLPKELERLILAMMEKDRDKRPSTVMDVRAELERIDRELALARRERVHQKTSDDATIVDMHSSELIKALEVASTTVLAEPAAAPISEHITIDTSAAAHEVTATATGRAIARPKIRRTISELEAAAPTTIDKKTGDKKAGDKKTGDKKTGDKKTALRKEKRPDPSMGKTVQDGKIEAAELVKSGRISPTYAQWESQELAGSSPDAAAELDAAADLDVPPRRSLVWLWALLIVAGIGGGAWAVLTFLG